MNYKSLSDQLVATRNNNSSLRGDIKVLARKIRKRASKKEEEAFKVKWLCESFGPS